MIYLEILTIFIFGLCFGSFITMASYRFGLENISVKDFIFRNSFCPKCNKQLKFWHLFPLFSWLFYKGKCAMCRSKISIRYPLIEIITSAVFVSAFLALGQINLELILILLMVVLLLIMIIVDLENYFIPNQTLVALAILIFIYHLLIPSGHNLGHYILSAIGFFLFGIIIHFGFLFFTKKHGIGEDDLKFFAIAGLMLGIDRLMIYMILNGVFGAIFGIIWMKLKKDETFPFAPAITIAFFICVIFDIDYIEWFGYLLYLLQKHILGTAY